MMILTLVTGCIGTDVIDPQPLDREATLAITPANGAAMIGEPHQFHADYIDETGVAVEGAPFRWSSSNTSVATIDVSSGVANALAPGQVTISVDLMDPEPLRATALFTVVRTATSVSSVVIAPHDADLVPSMTLQLTAEARDFNGNRLSIANFVWRSSNPSVVDVDGTGLATALALGTADVSAEVDGIASAPITLRVTASNAGRTGAFAGRGSYTVRGNATLSPKPGGGLTLDFSDDFSTSRGPDLQIILSASQTLGSQSVSLGRLKNATGAQSYDVPADVELDTYDFVLVHCVPFNVSFGSARLE